jgi:hypothetical protein
VLFNFLLFENVGLKKKDNLNITLDGNNMICFHWFLKTPHTFIAKLSIHISLDLYQCQQAYTEIKSSAVNKYTWCFHKPLKAYNTITLLNFSIFVMTK